MGVGMGSVGALGTGRLCGAESSGMQNSTLATLITPPACPALCTNQIQQLPHSPDHPFVLPALLPFLTAAGT